MLSEITTANGSQKPTPKIILALLTIALVAIWTSKDQLIALTGVTPEISTVISTAATGILIYVANLFGIKLPGNNNPPTV